MRRLLYVAVSTLACMGCAGETATGPVTFVAELRNTSAPGALATSAGPVDIVLAPGVFAVAPAGWHLYELGSAAPAGLEALAEDGSNTPLLVALAGRADVSSSGAFGVDVIDVSYASNPISPGDVVQIVFEARSGERLHLASMFTQSNDVALGTAPAGIDPFRTAARASADATSELGLFDTGTEVDEEPGAGPTQAPRQPAPNTGTDEHGTVTAVDASRGFPPVGAFATLTVRQRPM